MLWFTAIAAVAEMQQSASQKAWDSREREFTQMLWRDKAQNDEGRRLEFGLQKDQRIELRRLLAEHGHEATYMSPISPKNGKTAYKARPFRHMTKEELRSVLDMMLGKRKRDALAEALKAEQESIANQTYRNPESEYYDPLRVYEEKRATESGSASTNSA
jgi:hypothetical protein